MLSVKISSFTYLFYHLFWNLLYKFACKYEFVMNNYIVFTNVWTDIHDENIYTAV